MIFEELITLENIYEAWKDFSKGKTNKNDVIKFKMNLEDELLKLYSDLKNKRYKHGAYSSFIVNEPKQRVINKALVRDRVVHRLLYNYLLSRFNRTWLDCSYSCRPGFGQHLAIEKARLGIMKFSGNYSRESWVIKCDIKKFFDNIDQNILYSLICEKVDDGDIRRIIKEILESYFCKKRGVGIPIGNLTSQIFANVYMHQLDLFAKHEMKLRFYYRYADDFMFLVKTRQEGLEVVEKIKIFLQNKLRLEMHPQKIVIRPAHQGIDWLGKIILPGVTLLRSGTRKRMIKNIKYQVQNGLDLEKLKSVVASYNGLLKGTPRKAINSKILQAVAFYH